MGDAEEISAELVSTELFSMLNVKPALGRLFAAGEDEIGAAPIALITTGLWERKFGSSPSVLGSDITLDGRSYTVVGVIPRRRDPNIPSLSPADAYVPIGLWTNNLLTDRGAGLHASRIRHHLLWVGLWVEDQWVGLPLRRGFAPLTGVPIQAACALFLRCAQRCLTPGSRRHRGSWERILSP